MKKEDWNASHLGKKVRLLSENYNIYYRLESLTYHYGSDSVMATLITIVPSHRPGVLSHFDLASIELAE
jgi:hypothetical protein